MKGDIPGALRWNPTGILLVVLMFISPLWILYDILFFRNTFVRFYHALEERIRRKWIAIPMIALVVANWVWNIIKGL
jgi:hypothetical protein